MAEGWVSDFQSRYSWPLNMGVRGDDPLCSWNLHITYNWPTSLHPWIQPTSDHIVSILVAYMVEKKFVYNWTCTVRAQVVQESTIIIWSEKALNIVYSWHVIYLISIEEIRFLYFSHFERNLKKSTLWYSV